MQNPNFDFSIFFEQNGPTVKSSEKERLARSPKRKRGRRGLKMARKGPLHLPQGPFSPHVST
jgi:hypothetical protein